MKIISTSRNELIKIRPQVWFFNPSQKIKTKEFKTVTCVGITFELVGDELIAGSHDFCNLFQLILNGFESLWLIESSATLTLQLPVKQFSLSYPPSSPVLLSNTSSCMDRRKWCTNASLSNLSPASKVFFFFLKQFGFLNHDI